MKIKFLKKHVHKRFEFKKGDIRDIHRNLATKLIKDNIAVPALEKAVATIEKQEK